MRPISAILFDLDDTLLDAGVAWRAGVAGLIDAKAPGQVDIERGLSAWGSAFTTWFDPYLDGVISLETSRTGRIRHWADQLGLDVPGGTELEWFDAYVVGYRAGWGRFADVDPMLAALPPIPLGLVTNGDGVMQRAKVTALGLDDRLDVIVVSDEFGTAKPDPAIFLAAAHQLGVDPTSCLMVGDRLDRDISGALAAGMRAAWVQRLDGPEAATVIPSDLAGRFATVSSLTELLPLIGRS